MKKQRYTILEILTVLVIVSFLIAMALGIASYAANKRAEYRTQASLKIIQQALEAYRKEFGTYPFAAENIVSPILRLPGNDGVTKANFWKFLPGVTADSSGNPTGVQGLTFVKDGNDLIPLDGWRKPIVYLYPGVFNKTGYDLGSLGSNRQFGEDSSLDLTPSTSSGLGSRSSGIYVTSFGTVDDIVNFKR